MRIMYLSRVIPALVLSAFSLLSCAKKSGVSVESGSAETAGTETVRAVDMLGREVEVPARPSRVLTDRILPFPSTYFVAVRSTMEEVIAMHPASKSAAVNSMLNILAPGVSKASGSMFNGNTPNIEDVMALNPDLVFAFADEEGLIDPYVTAGITALGIKAASAAGGDALETLRGWFTVLAYTGGDKARMESILSEGEGAKQMIAEALAGSDEPNPRGVIIFSTSGNNLEIAGGNFFSEYWLKHTGAEDPASGEFKGRKLVNMEQLYAWDPDIIYITNFTGLQPEDIYNNPPDGQDWSSLKAVQNSRVYKIPLGIYRWFPPSGDAPLMLKWMAQKNHPGIFTYSIEAEIKDYYAKHYGYTLSDAEVSLILNPAAAAAAGYSTGS